jgi:hypothetical protein
MPRCESIKRGALPIRIHTSEGAQQAESIALHSRGGGRRLYLPRQQTYLSALAMVFDTLGAETVQNLRTLSVVGLSMRGAVVFRRTFKLLFTEHSPPRPVIEGGWVLASWVLTQCHSMSGREMIINRYLTKKGCLWWPE